MLTGIMVKIIFSLDLLAAHGFNIVVRIYKLKGVVEILYQVKDLAKLCKVPPDTVRQYTRIGLLRPERDPVNGYFKYRISDSKRLDSLKKREILDLG